MDWIARQPWSDGNVGMVGASFGGVSQLGTAGSSIRRTIDGPTGLTSGIGFDDLKTPAVNTIYHNRQYRSRLVLPLIPGQTAGTPLPACGTIDMEPCRPDLGHCAGE